ncbi:hypothetical protein ACFSSF_11700 [Dietzia aerolata]|uniref:hypothetical protein n=1 Tax=Dietzia aerolata TaxID=595984 RepID=UPI00363D3CB0
MATLLVKPDGIATGSARTVVDWALRSGFEIHDAAAVSMDHNGIRALWYHQWNIASAERRLLADLLCGLSPRCCSSSDDLMTPMTSGRARCS